MGDFRGTAGGAECCCELGSPIVHIGSPARNAALRSRSSEVSLRRHFKPTSTSERKFSNRSSRFHHLLPSPVYASLSTGLMIKNPVTMLNNPC